MSRPIGYEVWDDAVNLAHGALGGGFRECRLYSARGGESVFDAARAMAKRAVLTGCPVICSFNSRPMVARPGEDPGMVVQRWGGNP